MFLFAERKRKTTSKYAEDGSREISDDPYSATESAAPLQEQQKTKKKDSFIEFDDLPSSGSENELMYSESRILESLLPEAL